MEHSPNLTQIAAQNAQRRIVKEITCCHRKSQRLCARNHAKCFRHSSKQNVVIFAQAPVCQTVSQVQLEIAILSWDICRIADQIATRIVTQSLVWAWNHTAAAEISDLHEAFIKNDLLRDWPGLIGHGLKCVFCVEHSSQTTFCWPWRALAGHGLASALKFELTSQS